MFVDSFMLLFTYISVLLHYTFIILIIVLVGYVYYIMVLLFIGFGLCFYMFYY